MEGRKWEITNVNWDEYKRFRLVQNRRWLFGRKRKSFTIQTKILYIQLTLKRYILMDNMNIISKKWLPWKNFCRYVIQANAQINDGFKQLNKIYNATRHANTHKLYMVLDTFNLYAHQLIIFTKLVLCLQ